MHRCSISVSRILPHAAAVALAAIIPVPAAAARSIRNQHNYRPERNHKLLRQRFRYSRTWEFTDGPQGVENYKTYGHELEAFDNFARYAFDARTAPSVEVATNDLRLLEPRERYLKLTALIEKTSAAKTARPAMLLRRLKLTLQAAECFEDMCRLRRSGAASSAENPALHDDGADQRELLFQPVSSLDENDQYNMRLCLRSVINIVSKTRHEHPDSVAAAMRAVQIASNLRDDSERRFMLQRVRGFVSDLDDASLNYRPPRSHHEQYRGYGNAPRGRIDPGEREEDVPPLRMLKPSVEDVARHRRNSETWSPLYVESTKTDPAWATVRDLKQTSIPATREKPPAAE